MGETVVRSIALLAAVVPAFLILSYFLAAARVRVDAPSIWSAFGFGACTAFPAVLIARLFELSLGFGTGPLEGAARQAFLGAAVPEEFCKFLALVCLCGRQFRTLSENHLFALAIATACGFACLENIFYVVDPETWRSTAVLRSLTAVPGHAFMGAAMGFAMVQAVHRGGGVAWWMLALVIPIGFHSLYNFPLLAMPALTQGAGADAHAQTWYMVALFVAVVIAEGVAAHLFLHRIGGESGARQATVAEIAGGAAAQWFQRLFTFPPFWGLVGLLCWAGAVAVLWGPVSLPGWDGLASTAAATSFRRGLAVFAALHGVAFVGLAAVIARRRAIA